MNEETITVTFGDVWQLGRHRLMCGDSTDEQTVSILMGGTKADMLFTDPPYGCDYQSARRPKIDRFDKLKNDDRVLDFFPIVKKFCEGFVYVCTSYKVLDDWSTLFKSYYDLTNLIVWHKCRGGMGDLKRTYSTDYELLLCAHNGQCIRGKRIGSVWSIPTEARCNYKHPTQKPIELPMIAIEHSTDEGDVVLDVFGGSGSTLIACEQLNRNCYMMELDPKYCDVIIKRWESFTGKRAELVKEVKE